MAQYEDDGTIGPDVKGKTFTVNMPTGKMKTGLLFGDSEQEALTSVIASCRFHEVGAHVIRCAINCYPTFYFDNLKHLYPSLRSVDEFINSQDYLQNLNLKIIGREQSVEAYSQSDKLFIAKDVLRQLEPLLNKRGKSYRGTKLFKPAEFKNTFRKKVTLNFAKQASNSDQERGVSMKSSIRVDLRADLAQMDWYAYNDFFGTSEEKALIKYIEGIKDKLLEKYVEFYLVRNECDLKIYSFKTGAPFEPDFILFLRRKGKDSKFDNLQIFIEPKGENLRKQDAWKEEFLMEIKEMAELQWSTSANDYNVWGVPFFTEQNNEAFYDAFNKEVIADAIPCGQEEVTEEKKPFRIIPTADVSTSDRFTRYLPLYDVAIACGALVDEGVQSLGNNDVDVEGWIDISGQGVKPNKLMFIVHAKGESMLPTIRPGDLCVFEVYGGQGNAGSRNGHIVLARQHSKDNDYNCQYTIKEYHSEKDPMTGRNVSIELRPKNPDYASIVLTEDDDVQIIATFVSKIN